MVVPRAGPGKILRDVAGGRQIPRFGVAVAVVRHVSAVQVRDDWNRTRVRRRIMAVHVPAHRSSGRIRPVKCLVHWQQVRQVVAVGVDQLIDPFHARAPIRSRFDRERRITKRAAIAERAVSPDGCLRKRRREDLLIELSHTDRVVVRRRVAAGERHRRWNRQRPYETWDDVGW
jgi:hypothetical protein